ncbi:MAG: hypothetical protein KKA19_01370 [Candidatus Margulisbacteria bacterium]|nr:hypothetical protein [Candidatus Margulisiibacteriota bacterium]
MYRIQEPKKIAKVFAEELQHLLGNNLKSVFLYGSIASGEFFPNKSNLNFLVVLEKLDPLTLTKLSERSCRWAKKFKVAPLFLKKQEIFEALDAFPIEFLEMKDKHILIYGENIFRKIKIARKDLRLQCENSLRGKMILLRQGYLHNRGNVKNLLAQSSGAIAILLRSILFLKKEKVPLKREEVIKQTCEEFDLNPQPFYKALELRKIPFIFKTKELHFVFQNYLEELEKLIKKINELKTR